MPRKRVVSAGVALSLALSLLAGAAISLSASPIQAANEPPAFGLRVNLLGGGDITPLLNAAQIMRSDWIAQSVLWKDIEPAPGAYHWEKLDAMLETARPYGFRVLLSLAGTPDWARPAGSDLTHDGPPADYAAFANFASKLATRYAGMVAAYEIWPEANLISRWSALEGVSAANYTELLRQTSASIRAADPMTIIIAGSLAPTGAYDGFNVIDDLTFYQAMYNAGAASYFDALGTRVDGYNNPPADSPTSSSVTTTTYKGHTSFYFRHYENVREIMIANGDADKMLWITSAGWASTPAPIAGMEFASDVSEQQQAEYMIGALAQVQSQSYVAVVLVNNFNFSTTTSDPVQATYSLIRADWSARPAFVTLAQVRQDAASVTPPASASGQSVVHTLPNWSPRQRQPR